MPIVSANVCRNEPQPELQASLTEIESTALLRMRRYFMSCPPMSMTLVTPGLRWGSRPVSSSQCVASPIASRSAFG